MFWALLDQRLPNTLAAAITLVDHTRRLTDFYEPQREYVGEFLDEWTKRNNRVQDSAEGTFLRKSRNFLLHYGAAPLAHSISLGPTSAVSPSHITIRLSVDGLLRWDGWNRAMKDFIEGYREGPPIRDIVLAYARNTEEIYRWLLDQHARLHVRGEVPGHLR